MDSSDYARDLEKKKIQEEEDRKPPMKTIVRILREEHEWNGDIEEEEDDDLKHPLKLMPDGLQCSIIFGLAKNDPAVMKLNLRIRRRQLDKILGIQNQLIKTIQLYSKATIIICSDTKSLENEQMYLLIRGTESEVETAEYLITRAITKGVEEHLIPRALMPAKIRYVSYFIDANCVEALLDSDVGLMEMEAKSRTWMELYVNSFEGTIYRGEVHIYGEGKDVTNACMILKTNLCEVQT